MSDIIRVIRVIEYVGERSEVERVLERSVEGKYVITDKLTINATTIRSLPEPSKNQEVTMKNKNWCSDVYELNSSNTTFTFEHDSLYREYAATSIGDLIDKMQNHIDTSQGKLDEIKEIL